ncbi:MAG TPA: SPOR domain-containing protein [Terriglobia bacterium]|nr:SPOR domain-containing protein [Terriglobia bacterium]
MEDQTSWKGHSFTLLVFTGIVVLCSIFFILGMLVGRAQGQKLAFSASAGVASKVEAKPVFTEESKPDLTFYDSVKRSEPTFLEPPPASHTDAVISDTPRAAGPEPAPANIFNYQIGALRKSADAEKFLAEVKKKGFRAFILAPASDDANPFFRVQVGPFANMIDADEAKKKLESAGYQPILKK